MANVAAKRNNFILIPYRMLRGQNGKRTSVLGSFILGQIWSFSKEGNECNYGYNNFVERLNVSKATVARQIATIKERDDVETERHGGKCTTYTTSFELGDGAYIDVPLWLTKPFEITYHKRENGVRSKEKTTETVTLTPSEQLVLAMLYTETKGLNKKGKEAYECSPATIAAKLGKVVCARSVKGALLRLENWELIERKKVSKNAHGKGLGAYVANLIKFNSILSARRRAEKRANKQLEAAKRKIEELESKPTLTWQERKIQEQNEKSARESFYAARRNAAQNSADDYQRKAYARFPRLREISNELNKLEIEAAKAELFDPACLPKIKRRQISLAGERAEMMARGGLIPEAFDVEYYVKCPKCKDTGTLPNGYDCDCCKLQT